MDLFGGYRDMCLAFLEGAYIPRRPVLFCGPVNKKEVKCVDNATDLHQKA